MPDAKTLKELVAEILPGHYHVEEDTWFCCGACECESGCLDEHRRGKCDCRLGERRAAAIEKIRTWIETYQYAVVPHD